MTKLHPKILYIRTDVDNPDYKTALKELFFKENGARRKIYYYKKDDGERLHKIKDIASKLTVFEVSKVFDPISGSHKIFEKENKGKYKRITIDYDKE